MNFDMIMEVFEDELPYEKNIVNRIPKNKVAQGI